MKKKMFRITGEVDYVQGYLRYGHYEMLLDEKETEKFNQLSNEERAEYLREVGQLIVDDYSVDDVGNIESIEVEEIK